MNYKPYADKANGKLAKYGATIEVHRAGKQVYNPETNSYTNSGETFSGKAVQMLYDQRDIDGTNIKKGDVKFLAQLPKRPQSNDTVTFGGKTYTVINADPLNPDGTVDIIVYIQAR